MSSLVDDLRRAWWLSGLVRERPRFAAAEARHRGDIARYRLRALDARVVLRHNRTDAWVLHEVVRDGFYHPPEEVLRVLPDPGAHVRVVDLGGNLGFFGLLARARFPRAEITAFEPDPDNAALLRDCVTLNRADAWSVVEACAAPADGEVGFMTGGAALSRTAHPGETPATVLPAVDVFPYLHRAHMAKIDIEGGEWALLGDERFQRDAPPALLLEWHSYDCPGDNPRTEAERRLRALGYEVRHEKPAPVPDEAPLWGAGALWAWRA